MFLWKWFDLRSRKLFCEKGIQCRCALACAGEKKRSFWNCEVLVCGIVCVATMALVLALVFQHKICHKEAIDPSVPAPAYLGAPLSSPAAPGGQFDAARPEWSFRALYHMSRLPIFSKIGMIYAIFGVTSVLAIFFFAIPIISRIKFLHWPVLVITLGLLYVTIDFTYKSYWDDYKNPDHAPAFLASVADADRLAKRSIELCTAPDGIPSTGALTLLKKDPFIQGPKLFTQHCASCHNFVPFGSSPENPDFREIVCAEPSAPNLYNAISREWIGGFCDLEKLLSDNFFGKTTDFAKKGSMKTYLSGRVFGGNLLEDGSLILNSTDGLIGQLIAADASPAFDILLSVLEDMAADDAIRETIEAGEYLDTFKEKIAEKFEDEAYMAGLDPVLPLPVANVLKEVLVSIVDDEVYQELLLDEDNISSYILDDDIETFLTDTYLAQLNGNDEPIPEEDQGYVKRLREGIYQTIKEVEEVLYEESQLEVPRTLVNGQWEGLNPVALPDITFLRCTECHPFYGTDTDHACDLRGYMSKPWLIGIISDPTSAQFYGAKNDRMPAYAPAEGDQLMKPEEVEMLADWLHSRWYRPNLSTNSSEGEE